MEDKDIKRLIDSMESRDGRIAQVMINLTKYDYMPRCVWDFNGRFIYANKKFANLLGYEKQDVIGKQFTDFIFSEDIEKSMNIYSKNTSKEIITVVEGFENRYVKKDGTLINIIWLRGFNDFENKIGSGQCIEKI